MENVPITVVIAYQQHCRAFVTTILCSVFAQKVVEERDDARCERDEARAEVARLTSERDEALANYKFVVARMGDLYAPRSDER